MTRYDLSTFGEGQLRLTIPSGDRLLGMSGLRVTGAGSEANVAGALAQLGHATAWASVLPEGDLAERFLSEYRSAGVDLSHVRRVPTGRVATYYLEPGDGDLPARVVYDREGTPIRTAAPADFDWDALLDTRLLLVSGITAALTAETGRLVAHAVDRATERGVGIVVDVNHRALLWDADAAAAALEPPLRSAALAFCARRDAATLFGIVGEAPDVAARIAERFGIAKVVVTDGPSGAALAVDGVTTSAPALRVPVIDRPGAGDAFVAGVLHGYLTDDLSAGLVAGCRAAALALTHHGDLLRLRLRDLEGSDGDIVR